jgi:hypothetical protein
VWNFGELAPEAQVTFATGFLVDGDTPAESVVNTGTDWKCARDESDSPAPAREVHAYFVVGPGDRVAGPQHPWGWEGREFDDSNWPAALVAGRCVHHEPLPDAAGAVHTRLLAVVDRDGAGLLVVCGRPGRGLSEVYQAREKQLRETAQRLYWDAGRNLYADTRAQISKSSRRCWGWTRQRPASAVSWCGPT